VVRPTRVRLYPTVSWSSTAETRSRERSKVLRPMLTEESSTKTTSVGEVQPVGDTIKRYNFK